MLDFRRPGLALAACLILACAPRPKYNRIGQYQAFGEQAIAAPPVSAVLSGKSLGKNDRFKSNSRNLRLVVFELRIANPSNGEIALDPGGIVLVRGGDTLRKLDPEALYPRVRFNAVGAVVQGTLTGPLFNTRPLGEILEANEMLYNDLVNHDFAFDRIPPRGDREGLLWFEGFTDGDWEILIPMAAPQGSQVLRAAIRKDIVQFVLKQRLKPDPAATRPPVYPSR